MAVNPKLEVEAYAKLSEWLRQADQLRLMFEQARSPLPDVLQRLTRSNGYAPAAASGATSDFKVQRPPDVDPDWIWIDLKEVTPGTLALALLRESEAGMTARELQQKMRELGMDVSLGTIANVGTRAYENGYITRDDDGRWTLEQKERAGVLREDLVWAPPSTLQMQEAASYRRHAIVHLLKQNPVGLQQMQIVAQLRQQELVPSSIPVNKSLVKADLEAMDGSRVSRRGNSKKWEAK